MTCVHLRQLYALCQQEDLKLGGSDLIRIVCNQCGVQEVCPSMLMDEYEWHADSTKTGESAGDPAAEKTDPKETSD